MVVWLVVNVFIIRPYLNPTYPDMDRHKPILNGKITIWEILSDENGTSLPERWYDPYLKQELRWEYSLVTYNMNRERFGRVATTIVLGLLLVCYYKFRMKVHSESLRTLIAGIIILSLFCCSFNFINKFLGVIRNVFLCFVFIIPFISWHERDRIKGFFMGFKDVDK